MKQDKDEGDNPLRFEDGAYGGDGVVDRGRHGNPRGDAGEGFPLSSFDEAWARESRCLTVGPPICCVSATADVRQFPEKKFKACAPAGKPGGAFATADYVHGGGDPGIRLILDHMMAYGMLAYSGGSSFGKPVIHLGPVAISGSGGAERETFRLYGARMAQKALEIFPREN